MKSSTLGKPNEVRLGCPTCVAYTPHYRSSTRLGWGFIPVYKCTGCGNSVEEAKALENY